MELIGEVRDGKMNDFRAFEERDLSTKLMSETIGSPITASALPFQKLACKIDDFHAAVTESSPLLLQ